MIPYLALIALQSAFPSAPAGTDVDCIGHGYYQYFGSSVACAGDDDIADIAIADCSKWNNRGHLGRVWIVSGKDGRELHAWRGEQLDDGFGSDVRLAGNVDRDGCPDLAIGACGPRKNGYGYVWVCSGRTGERIYRLSTGGDDGFGAAVAGVGDVDGDGFDDVAVAAPGADCGEVDPPACRFRALDVLSKACGRVLVYSGRTGALALVLQSEETHGTRFGADVAGIGDFDGDGNPDIAVAHEGGAMVPTLACVFSGRDGRELLRIQRRFEDAQDHVTVRAAGDVDGDGRHELLLGYDQTAEVVSRYGVLWRSSRSRSQSYGAAVAPLGDLDRDGTTDFLVAEPDEGIVFGKVHAVSGAPEARPMYTTECSLCGHWGASLDVLGDVDDDGVADFVASADESRSGEPGRVRVLSGRKGDWHFSLTRQGEHLKVAFRDSRH